MNSIEKMVDIVKKIKNNELSVISGARQIGEFRDSFIANEVPCLNYKDVSLFFDIIYESSGLPVSDEERKNWDSEALKVKDLEINKIEEKYREQIKDLCSKITLKMK